MPQGIWQAGLCSVSSPTLFLSPRQPSWVPSPIRPVAGSLSPSWCSAAAWSRRWALWKHGFCLGLGKPPRIHLLSCLAPLLSAPIGHTGPWRCVHLAVRLGSALGKGCHELPHVPGWAPCGAEPAALPRGCVAGPADTAAARVQDQAVGSSWLWCVLQDPRC